MGIYVDLEGPIRRSGIATAVDHHRRALAGQPVAVEHVRIRPRTLAGDADFDVLHTHLFGPGSWLLAASAARRDVPLVCHAHVTAEDFAESFRGSSLAAGPIRRFLRRWYGVADLVIAPSAYARQTIEAYPVRAPIAVVSNGVDLASLDGHDTLRDAYRARYDLEGTVVATVGNVFERKGLTTFCRVASRCPDLAFVWFGRIDRWPLASRRVRRWVRNPPPNVTFAGWADDKRGAFGAADIYFSPAKVENQGIAVLEAMACGLPVVLSDIPPFRELTVDGVDALRADTIDGFVGAIERLRDDETMRDGLATAARQTANTHRLEAVGARLVELYDRLLSGDETLRSTPPSR